MEAASPVPEGKSGTGIKAEAVQRLGVTQPPQEDLTSIVERSADASLPPMDEKNLAKLVASYSTSELQMLGSAQKAIKAVPPVQLQQVIRMVRRRDPDDRIAAYIRDNIPGIPAKSIAYEWAMHEIHGPDKSGNSPLLQGGGPVLVESIRSTEGEQRPAGAPIHAPQKHDHR